MSHPYSLPRGRESFKTAVSSFFPCILKRIASSFISLFKGHHRERDIVVAHLTAGVHDLLKEVEWYAPVAEYHDLPRAFAGGVYAGYEKGFLRLFFKP